MKKHLFKNLIFDFFCPRHCVRCGKIINDWRSVAVCGGCERIVTFPQTVRSDEFDFDGAVAVLPYCDAVKKSMLKYKFGSCKYYGAAFAKCIADVVGSYPLFSDSLVCCVPVSDSRNRAYSQTGIIAEELCRILNLPLAQDLILRTKDIAPLSAMPLNRRNFNIQGVFDVNTSYDVFGKNIVVIDDIYTSGTTLSECAAVLKSHGAAKVWAVCACYD